MFREKGPNEFFTNIDPAQHAQTTQTLAQFSPRQRTSLPHSFNSGQVTNFVGP